MAKAAEIRRPAGCWEALSVNPGYRADWRAHGGAPSVVGSAGFALRTQTEADREAARWGLLAWEDPRERSRFRPFWIDEKMLEATVGGQGEPVGKMARASGMSVAGLRLLDGALVLKVRRWRRVEQIRVLEGDAFDIERTGLKFQYVLDGFPPTVTPRLRNLAAMTEPPKNLWRFWR